MTEKTPAERLAALRIRAGARRKANPGPPRQDSSPAPQWMREAQFRTEAWTRDDLCCKRSLLCRLDHALHKRGRHWRWVCDAHDRGIWRRAGDPPTDDEVVARVRRKIAEDVNTEAADFCHCGEPVRFGYDDDPTHTRGMCDHCDSVRCDVDPRSCGR